MKGDTGAEQQEASEPQARLKITAPGKTNLFLSIPQQTRKKLGQIMLPLLRSALFPLQWRLKKRNHFPSKYAYNPHRGQWFSRAVPHGRDGTGTVADDDGLLITEQLCLHEGQPDALSSCNCGQGKQSGTGRSGSLRLFPLSSKQQLTVSKGRLW